MYRRPIEDRDVRTRRSVTSVSCVSTISARPHDWVALVVELYDAARSGCTIGAVGPVIASCRNSQDSLDATRQNSQGTSSEISAGAGQDCHLAGGNYIVKAAQRKRVQHQLARTKDKGVST